MDGTEVTAEAIGAGELYARHATFVTGLFARMGTPHRDLADLTQEVFLTAHRRGGFVPGPAKATTWLAEIAVNVLRNHRRTQRRRPLEPGEPDTAAASGPDPEAASASRQALRQVASCLSELDDDHREVFVLFELEGLPAAEVADVVGVKLGTVYSRLHHARKQFKAAWESKKP
jgi:RNA polymerase sigma-70 factor (ECF subfamily)